MAWILKSYIVNPEDEEVFMAHEFYGRTREDCKSTFDEHLGSCSYFRSAVDDGRTFEKWIEIDEDELPVAEKAEAGRGNEEDDED